MTLADEITAGEWQLHSFQAPTTRLCTSIRPIRPKTQLQLDWRSMVHCSAKWDKKTHLYRKSHSGTKVLFLSTPLCSLLCECCNI